MALLNMMHALLGFFAYSLAAIAAPVFGNAMAINGTTSGVERAVNARYILTAFTSTSESNLYVYTSSDATTWSLLAGPTYTPPTGLIRDPSVLYHSDGKYYIAYTTNWSGQNFAIASSTDLTAWTLHATISTSSSVISPINTWAPEWFRDPKDGKIKIIVSLSTGSYGPFLPYVFTANDSTLKSFSTPMVMSGISNSGLGYIDSFPVYLNGQYHLFTKHETSGTKVLEHAVASSITGPYSFVQTGDFAGWGHAEGPCITLLPDGVTYRLVADGFDSGKYIYSDSKDLYTWSAYKNFTGGLSGFIRHGTILKQS
ncbi:arabinosidase [Auriculariales sp. MPI-PUGE-AT-0066]|nr:arabinosidase [Auriculariales sp. MPI-PUGE-AT-0066]